MVNIFKSFAKADDDTAAMQIAVLRNVTLKNLTAPKAKKVAGKAVGIAKGLLKIFGKNISIPEPEVKEIDELIREDYSELKKFSRPELDRLLRKEIAERVSMTFVSGEEKISAAVISEAAKNFDDIGEFLTSAQKADAVAQKMYNQIRNKINEELRKQTVAQAAQTEIKLDEEISKMSMREKEEMRKALNVDELTGKTIRKTILQAGLSAVLIGSTSGLGLFVATTTIIHAVFTTALGITLPFFVYSSAMSVLGFLTGPAGLALVAGIAAYNLKNGNKKINREILSQFIYTAFVYNGRSFAPLENELEQWKSYKSTLHGSEKIFYQLAPKSP